MDFSLTEAQTDLAEALGLLVQAAHSSDRTRASRAPRHSGVEHPRDGSAQ